MQILNLKPSSPPVYLTGLLLLTLFTPYAWSHGVTASDSAFIQQSVSAKPIPFIYLGAKHMVTGYDHLLFLSGVVFFLYRLREVALYVTLFALGHSITLLFGVLGELSINPYLVDAVIGFSVVYKALDNQQAFRRWGGVQPDTRSAVFIFGLFHGFGLASKLQDYALPEPALLPNLLAFNAGVEIGQLLALGLILLVMNLWRTHALFSRQAFAANTLLMAAGFTLMGYQLTGYYITRGI